MTKSWSIRGQAVQLAAQIDDMLAESWDEAVELALHRAKKAANEVVNQLDRAYELADTDAPVTKTEGGPRTR